MFGDGFGGILFGEQIDGGFWFGGAIPGGELLGERVEREKGKIIVEVMTDWMFDMFSEIVIFGVGFWMGRILSGNVTHL